MQQEIAKGTYQHYKGNKYEVIGLGTHTETDERVVIYKSPLDDKFWVRPADMFAETVEVNGKTLPRFEKISE